MKRKIYFTILLMLVILLLFKIKVNASLRMIGTDGYSNGYVTKHDCDPKVTGDSGVGIKEASSTGIGVFTTTKYAQTETIKSGSGTIVLNKALSAGSTTKVTFYVIDEDSAASFNKEVTREKAYESENCVYTITDNYVDSLIRPHNRVDVTIKTKETGSKGEVKLKIPIAIKPSGYSYNVYIKIPQIIGVGNTLKSEFLGQGYIPQDYEDKLKGEKDTKMEHKFGTSNNLEENAEGFIDTYKFTDKTKLFDYPETLKFEDWNGYDGVKKAEIGFNFKTSMKQRIYGRDRIGSGGKWIVFFFEEGEEHSAHFDIIYITSTKEFMYRVVYGDKDDEDLEGLVEEEQDSDAGVIDDLVDDLKEIRTFISQVLGDRRKEVEYIDALKNTDAYKPKDDLSSDDVKKVENTVGTIIAIITNIGIVLSIIVPAVLGVKYMIASVEEKAEMKEGLVPYFIGSVMLFGICTIVKIIQFLGQEINKI